MNASNHSDFFSSSRPNPHSKLEIHLENWIMFRFQSNSDRSHVGCVPTSDLLNSWLSSNSLPAVQQSLLQTDQVVEHCCKYYLKILGHHFDQRAVGGRINFLRPELLDAAHSDASTSSRRRCNILCKDNNYDELTTERILYRLDKFVLNSNIEIKQKNWIQIVRYLEANKRNIINKLCETCKDQFSGLFKDSSHSLIYYDPSKVSGGIDEMISEAIQNFKMAKQIAVFHSYHGEDYVIASFLPSYKNDLEKSLQNYRRDILLINIKRIEEYFNENLLNTSNECKEHIENMLSKTEYFDQLTFEDINRPVLDWNKNFIELTKVAVSYVNKSIQEQMKNKINEKVSELLTYTQNLLQLKIDKTFSETVETEAE